MGRYKKVIMGESELKEIDGNKFVIYPTIATRMDVLDIFKITQQEVVVDVKNEKGVVVETKHLKGDLDIKKMAKVCADMIYEACFEHDAKGNRTRMKDECMDDTYDNIHMLVVNSGVVELYLAVAAELGILSKTKAEDISKRIKEEEKN